MEDTYCIYMHVNKINDKKYVGMTKHGNEPNKRWLNGNGYKYHKLFWPDIQKYGWDSFEHLILENNLTKEKAMEKEKEYTLKHKSHIKKHGYNIAIGSKANEETKQKISELHKGKYTGNKNPMYGKIHSENTIKKMSEAKKGKKSHLRGKTRSIETKRKISEKLKGGKSPLAKKCIICYNNIKYETNSISEMMELFKTKYNISIYSWIINKIPVKYIGNVQLIQINDKIVYKFERW